MQALDHEDIGTLHGIERARLVLAVLELALLVGDKRLPEGGGDSRTELGSRREGEQTETIRSAHRAAFRSMSAAIILCDAAV